MDIIVTAGNTKSPIESKEVQPTIPDSEIQLLYRPIEKTQISKEMFNQILCPNLRIGVRMSLLNPDESGWVCSNELLRFLEYLGVKKESGIANFLVNSGERASTPKRDGFVNIVNFRDTALDHKSSSGILNTPEGFSESRLSFLKQYAGEDNRLTVKKVSRAINHFHQCPHLAQSVTGTHIQSLEMSIVIDIYGRTDNSSKEKYLTRNDIDSIWRDNKFPEGWTAPKSPEYGTLEAIGLYIKMISARVTHGWKNTVAFKN